MRIWSIHPKYLDSKGLVALWREALLAKKVLENKTRGYRHHPQLTRFKASKKPLGTINYYLLEIYLEALKRNYSFNKKKITIKAPHQTLPVTAGQVKFEVTHLKKKLEKRDKKKLQELRPIKKFETHPLFVMVAGDREAWEKP